MRRGSGAYTSPATWGMKLGGWGEDAAGCISGAYIEHRESQVIQTTWALMTLLEARDPDWGAIVRGSRFLIEQQEESGG